MDVLFLSRLQFALTISFHYIYPPLSIGLGIMLVIIEGMWLKTGHVIYHQMARFWTRIFALTFAIGVATGIVMEFEFGTNWASYSRYVGDIFGSALAAEGIFAFFLESGFLAVLLFGWDRVGRKMHYFATWMVCLGSHFSAIWIVVANSWQQTPAGYHIVGEGIHARAEVTDFWAMVFNPSSMQRLGHALCGGWQAGSWLVVSVSAWYLWKRRHVQFAQRSMRVALMVAMTAAVLQLVTGHLSAEGVSRNQPAKLAAFEGHFKTEPATMWLFGWVNEKAQRVELGVGIPKMLSWMVYGNPDQPVTGLNEIPPDERPHINVVFQTYHAMVAIGMGLLGLAALGNWLIWRKRFYRRRWLQAILIFSVLGPQMANQFGWWSAEIGRQPWIVYKLLRTSEGLSRVIQAHTVVYSLVMFTLIYVLLFICFIYLLNEKIQHGPDDADLTPTGKLAIPLITPEPLSP